MRKLEFESRLASKERPILFKTEMVNAIVCCRKTMTRRIVTKSNSRCLAVPFESLDFNYAMVEKTAKKSGYLYVFCKDGEPINMPQKKAQAVFSKFEEGDILWVKETWANHKGSIVFRASDIGRELEQRPKKFKWKSSLFLKRSDARLLCPVQSVIPERLQDISAEDAINEGIDFSKVGNTVVYKDYLCDTHAYEDPVLSFKSLWIYINGVESWNSNPYVWVIKFEKPKIN